MEFRAQDPNHRWALLGARSPQKESDLALQVSRADSAFPPGGGGQCAGGASAGASGAHVLTMLPARGYFQHS